MNQLQHQKEEEEKEERFLVIELLSNHWHSRPLVL
jgi:hypothetical protein